MKARAEVWFAPGRANLMGEHTDYNEGCVLPFALAQGVTAIVSARDDDLLVLRSKQVPDTPLTAPNDSLAPGASESRGTVSGVSGTCLDRSTRRSSSRALTMAVTPWASANGSTNPSL